MSFWELGFHVIQPYVYSCAPIKIDVLLYLAQKSLNTIKAFMHADLTNQLELRTMVTWFIIYIPRVSSV